MRFKSKRTLSSRAASAAVAAIAAIGTLALTAAPAYPLTYVSVADSVLLEQAELVVRGTVASRWVGDETGRVMTSYQFDIGQVFKGRHSGSRLLVRVPGGIDLDQGLAVKIFGTPEFSRGESVLLFLALPSEGSYRVLHVFQGAFAERGTANGRIYERPGDEAFEVQKPAVDPGFKNRRGRVTIRPSVPVDRDADLFERWLADRVDGIDRPADYFLPDTQQTATALSAPFTYLAGDDFILRWFDFDDRGKVRWHRHSDGQEGFSGGGAKEFKKARKAWKKKFSGVRIKLTNAGTTSSTTGFTISDARNTLLHRDFNDEIDSGDFECPDGGTLAVGGVSSFDQLFTQWKGLSTLAVHEAEIIMNDGIDCFVQGDSDILGQIYAHELGHTLGLGHSCGDGFSPKCSKSEFLGDALMAAGLGDVFGAEIHDDDILAARQLYDEEFWAAACEKRVPGAKSFCSKCGPCGEGQGNCKKDRDCFGTLVCTKDVGAGFGFDEDVNVCTEP